MECKQGVFNTERRFSRKEASEVPIDGPEKALDEDAPIGARRVKNTEEVFGGTCAVENQVKFDVTGIELSGRALLVGPAGLPHKLN